MNNQPYVQQGQNMQSVDALKANQQANPYPFLNETAYEMAGNPNQGQMPYYGNQPAPPPPGLNMHMNMNLGYPQPYPNQMGPNGQVVLMRQNRANGVCPFCRNSAPVVTTKEMGCAIWVWTCIFFWFTGCCCWIPCIIDDCYDIRVVCTGCQATREVIRSRYSL